MQRSTSSESERHRIAILRTRSQSGASSNAGSSPVSAANRAARDLDDVAGETAFDSVDRDRGDDVTGEDEESVDEGALVAMSKYFSDFSHDLRFQVQSLSTCAQQNVRLDPAYRGCATSALSKLMSAIDTFCKEMDENHAETKPAADAKDLTWGTALSPRAVHLKTLSGEGAVQFHLDAPVICATEPSRASETERSADCIDSDDEISKDSKSTCTESTEFEGDLFHDETGIYQENVLDEVGAKTVRLSLKEQDTLKQLKELTFDIGSLQDSVARYPCVGGVFNPNWPGRLLWDMYTMLLVCLDAVILPFQLSYKNNKKADPLDNFWLYVATSSFALDILINLFTGYVAGENDTDYEVGVLVTNLRRVTRNYLTGWFSIDLFSTVPWGVVTSLVLGGNASGAGKLGKLTKIVKFARFLRLLRMMKLAKLAAIYEKFEARIGSGVLLQAIQISRVIFTMGCICHWNACIWWMIGHPKALFTELMSPESQAWWEGLPHWTTIQRRQCLACADEPTWTWLDRPSLESYLFSFYWTLGVMRTMPQEATPVNKVERIYLMFFMFAAFTSFAICIAVITQTFHKLSERTRTFNDDMAAVRRSLRDIEATESVSDKVKSFLSLLFHTRRIQAPELVSLRHVPKHVDMMLKQARYQSYLQRVKILRGLSARSIALINDLTFVRDNAPGDVLSNCRSKKPASSCYILFAGRLMVMEYADHRKIEKEKNIEVVDEPCLSTREDYFSPRTVVCQVASTVQEIRKDDFFDLLDKYPSLLEWRRGSIRQSTSSLKESQRKASKDSSSSR